MYIQLYILYFNTIHLYYYIYNIVDFANDFVLMKINAPCRWVPTNTKIIPL